MNISEKIVDAANHMTFHLNRLQDVVNEMRDRELGRAMEDVQRSFDILDGLVVDAATEIVALEGENEDLVSEVSFAESEADGYQDDILALEREIDDLDAANHDLRDSVGMLEAELADLRSAINISDD